jgi:hypothetical protein
LITVIATAVVALGLAMAAPSFASDGGDDCTMAQASLILNTSLCGPPNAGGGGD